MTRQEILDTLYTGIHSVTFTKVDGTERTMPCTLDPAIIPQKETVTENKKKPNENVIKVFVTDINEWRSFRINNLIKIENLN